MVSDQYGYRSACMNALQLASANHVTCSCTTQYWLKISYAFLVWRSRHKVSLWWQGLIAESRHVSIGWTSIHLRGLPTKRSKLPQLRFTHVFYCKYWRLAPPNHIWDRASWVGAVSTRNVSAIRLCGTSHLLALKILTSIQLSDTWSKCQYWLSMSG